MASDFGRGQQFSGVAVHIALKTQKFVKPLDAADDARLGTRLDAHVLQRAHKALQVIGRGMLNGHTGSCQVTGEFVHVVAIGLGRVAAHALLERQVAQEAPLHICYVGDISHWHI